MSGEVKGHSGRRVQHVWREVRVALEDKLRSYSLAQFAAKTLEEMYYI